MSDQLAAVLDALVPDLLNTYGVPGAAVSLIDGDESLAAGFGITNVEHPLPVDDRTLFQIGSVSKTLTATLVLQLVEESLVDLDAPVRTYLPDLTLTDPSVAASVTVRHLLPIAVVGWATTRWPTRRAFVSRRTATSRSPTVCGCWPARRNCSRSTRSPRITTPRS